MSSLLFRLQEWLADRSPHFQYPLPRRAPIRKRAPLFQWKHQMPITDRIFLALVFLAVIVLGLIGLSIGLFVLWVIMQSLFK